MLYLFEVAFDQRRCRFARQQAVQSIHELPVLQCPVAAQVVQAGARVCIDHPVRTVLAIVVIEYVDEDGMLQDVSVIAGVESVSITEQESSFFANRGRARRCAQTSSEKGRGDGLDFVGHDCVAPPVQQLLGTRRIVHGPDSHGIALLPNFLNQGLGDEAVVQIQTHAAQALQTFGPVCRNLFFNQQGAGQGRDGVLCRFQGRFGKG